MQLPIYVFVAGVEGAGHHALETVWRALEDQYDLHFMGYNPGVHAMAKSPDVSRAYQFASPDFNRYRSAIASFLKRPGIRDKPLVIDSRNSYPMGFGSGALTHPDLVYLSHLDGDLIDLRVLLVHRDPTACVKSAVRRFKVGEFQYKSYQFQARAVQESLSMINNAVRSLRCGKVAWLRYESFVKSPQQYAATLAQLLSVDEKYVNRAFGKIKPPSHKSARSAAADNADEEAKIAQDLDLFFKQQQHQWPIMAGEWLLPPLVDERGLLPVRQPAVLQPAGPIGPAGQSKDRDSIGDHEARSAPAGGGPAVPGLSPSGAVGRPGAAANPQPLPLQQLVPDTAERYLEINWLLHLGFNNMRFLLEIGFGMAHQLQRRLLLPSHLRMRRCVNEALCQASPCELRTRGKDVSYWCPITMFVDEYSLVHRGGGLIVPDMAAFEQQLPSDAIQKMPKAFQDVYDESQLWIDDLPSGIEPQEMVGNKYTGPLNEVTIFRYHLGCELSYFKVLHKRWSLRENPVINVFRRAFDSPKKLLHLEGVPHKIGWTPFSWATSAAAEAAEGEWTEAVAYAGSALRFAEAIREALLEQTGALTYVCVHLRRGDFVSAGWLGQAANLSLVHGHIKRVLQPKEALYLATDETGNDVLGGFRMLGARIWIDFADVLKAESQRPASAAFASHLGFEDYIGLVEQLLCGQARAFLGSQCSSFTGGILNLRRRMVGDTTYHIVGHPPTSGMRTS